MYEAMIRSGNYLDGQFWADSWCAAFVWKKTQEFNYPITEEAFRRIEHNPHACDVWMRAEIERLAAQYQFFHWHLAFPDVFHVPTTGQDAENTLAGWNGGFDVVLGNPPWDKIQPEEEKFFGTIRPDIAKAATSKLRKELIARLPFDDPPNNIRWVGHQRIIDSHCHFIKHSGYYPLSSDGNLNSYRIFTELCASIVSKYGRVGLVVQTAFATGESGKELFDYLLRSGRLRQFLDFENREGFFPDVDDRFRFCLITLLGIRAETRNESALFGWLLHELSELAIPGRLVRLSSNDLELFNPTSKTCPVLTSQSDLDVSKSIYANANHIYINETNKFGSLSLLGELFNLTRDSQYFVDYATGANGNVLPLFEAKYFHQFDHRFATAVWGDVVDSSRQEKEDCSFLVKTARGVDKDEVNRRLRDREIATKWLSGFRRISSGTNERTAIMSVLPLGAIGNTINLALGLTAIETAFLVGNVNSFAFDFSCRQKVSGTDINIWIFKQLPAIPLPRYSKACGWDTSVLSLKDWLLSRLLELIYSAWDIQPFAQDCGCTGAPFRWDEDRRFKLRCELDAAYFQLYLPTDANGDWRSSELETAEDRGRLRASFPTPRHAVAYIMDTFPIVNRKDEAQWGDYRTKRVILEIYDAMTEAARTCIPYQTRLDPPPADPSCRHPKKNVGILAFGSLIMDPGLELQPKITMRIKAKTPFPVEYARISRTRGGAPTLVPHELGGPVLAEILVLDDGISFDEARNMLWRRERRQEGTGESYSRGTGENSVLVEEFHDDPCVATVLYTDFNPSGKIPHPTAMDLAKRAIASVAAALEGMDGITYLMNALRSGIETPLTADYKAEILKQTLTLTLEDALKTAKGEGTASGTRS
jgi:hypothetical protein